MTDIYYSWAWTPHHVAEMEKAEASQSAETSLLILPEQHKPPPTDSALCHFSAFKNGEQHSWIWLFLDQPQAIALRLLPNYLDEDDQVSNLITATLPPRTPGNPPNTYLQVIPKQWLMNWNLPELGIAEVWVGFDHHRFRFSRLLEKSCEQYSVEEFLEKLNHAA